jgi:hypothetical protein
MLQGEIKIMKNTVKMLKRKKRGDTKPSKSGISPEKKFALMSS